VARTRKQTQSDSDPFRQLLIAQGLILPQHSSTTRAEADRAYQAYLEQLGDRHLVLTQAVLEDCVREQELQQSTRPESVYLDQAAARAEGFTVIAVWIAQSKLLDFQSASCARCGL
jgi:hypothetical protein